MSFGLSGSGLNRDYPFKTRKFACLAGQSAFFFLTEEKILKV
jgi:hypothetical protein